MVQWGCEHCAVPHLEGGSIGGVPSDRSTRIHRRIQAAEKKRGKVSVEWLGKNRVKTKTSTVTSFAGIMLSLIPLVNAFMQDVVEPSGLIPEERACFELLSMLIGLLTLGSDASMTCMTKI